MLKVCLCNSVRTSAKSCKWEELTLTVILRRDWLGSSSVGKAWRWWDSSWAWPPACPGSDGDQQHPMSIGRSTAHRWRKGVMFLRSALVRPRVDTTCPPVCDGCQWAAASSGGAPGWLCRCPGGCASSVTGGLQPGWISPEHPALRFMREVRPETLLRVLSHLNYSVPLGWLWWWNEKAKALK